MLETAGTAVSAQPRARPGAGRGAKLCPAPCDATRETHGRTHALARRVTTVRVWGQAGRQGGTGQVSPHLDARSWGGGRRWPPYPNDGRPAQKVA